MLSAKRCKCCGQLKSIYEFYSHYTSQQDILYITEDCKDCIDEIKSMDINPFIKYCK